MKTKQAPSRNIDEYIADFAPDVREILQRIRIRIRKAAPLAQERISYQIPCFTQQSNLVYFAAFKNHIGFYPTSSAVRQFKKELSLYEGAKGSVRFPLEQSTARKLRAGAIVLPLPSNPSA
jgi:uncharacterized protein YdhG (YjbR/CyaY superfamily)